MSNYELNRAILAIYIDRNLCETFKSADFGFLESFDLTEEEYTALIGRDFPKLWALHTHPMILFHISAVLNPREWYLENVVPFIQDVPNAFYDYYKESEGADLGAGS